MIVPVQFSTLPVTPWKNGGGETREIVSVASPDAPFLWRASIATLEKDARFLLFPALTGSSPFLRASRCGYGATILLSA